MTKSPLSCMGSIPASSDTVESEGWQMKQCWIKYLEKEKEIPKKYPFGIKAATTVVILPRCEKPEVLWPEAALRSPPPLYAVSISLSIKMARCYRSSRELGSILLLNIWNNTVQEPWAKPQNKPSSSCYLRRNSLEPEALDEDRNEDVRSFLGILGKCEVGSS
jgi:hypothetical protein